MLPPVQRTKIKTCYTVFLLLNLYSVTKEKCMMLLVRLDLKVSVFLTAHLVPNQTKSLTGKRERIFLSKFRQVIKKTYDKTFAWNPLPGSLKRQRKM